VSDLTRLWGKLGETWERGPTQGGPSSLDERVRSEIACQARHSHVDLAIGIGTDPKPPLARNLFAGALLLRPVSRTAMSLHQILVALALLLASAAVHAQEREFSGVVTERSSGAPVPDASVSNMEYSTQTDTLGRFRLRLPYALRDLVVYREGYQTAVLALDKAETDISVELVAFGEGGGETIEIVGSSNEATQAPHYELGPDEIRRVPGSGNDALKSLQSMPGVGRVPFGLGGIVLRGTSPRDSSVYLDGMEVPLLYHFGGLASFYPSANLKSLELVGGGYSSEYGRGQGGVVLIESREGRSDKWRASSEMSLIDLSLQADGPSGKAGAWSFGLRRSTIDAALPLVTSTAEATTAPRYYDGQIRYDADLGPRTKLAAQLIGSDDKIGFIYGKGQDKSFAYETRFARLGVQVKHQEGKGEYVVAPWFGVDEFKLQSTSQRLRSGNQPFGGRASYTRSLERGQLHLGTELSAGGYELASMTTTDRGTYEIDNSDSYHNSALWLESDLHFAERRINLRPGLRVEHYSLSSETVVDPRMVVTHELPRGIILRESLGLFHQPPSVADSLWGNEDLTSSYSTQATVGGEFPLSKTIRLSATGFYSDLRNLPIDDPTASMESLEHFYDSKIGSLSSSREFIAKQFGTFSVLRNTGAGRNYGAEVLAKYVGERSFAWLSYTGSVARRRDTKGADMDWKRYVLDQPHVLTLVASHKLSSAWQIGGRARYASGNPVTPIEGGQPIGEGNYIPIHGDAFSERLPDFFQLDVRVDREWKRPWGTVGAFLDLQNLTARKNVEGRSYEDDFSSYETTNGLPLFPAFGLVYSPAP
jgi:hypothetical protein